LLDIPAAEHGGIRDFQARCHIRNITQVLAEWSRSDITVRIPFGIVANVDAEVEVNYERLRAMGFEGAMVKSLQHTYEPGKRTYGWLKVKPEADADGQIVGFEEAICGVDQPEHGLKKGDNLQRIGSVLLHCTDGSQVAPHGIPHELGRDMYTNPQKYMGQWVEFKYMERDRQGGYRHPTFNRLREEPV
jgi:ATP-dependent DNA ligase